MIQDVNHKLNQTLSIFKKQGTNRQEKQSVQCIFLELNVLTVKHKY